jgi:hypothetical protein
MKLNKILMSILLLVMLFSNVFSVVIVENAPPPEEEKKPLLTEGQKQFLVIALIVTILLGLIFLLIWWIWKKIKENERKDKDLLFAKYLIDCKNTHLNRDHNLKYKNWKTLFFTYKRGDIILNTENGLKVFGRYDGELIVKDAFVLITLWRKQGFFKPAEQDIIIIPYEARKLIRKENVTGDWQLTIEAESIDEALNTDYYAQIVVKNPKNKDKLVNFNEYIVTEFMDKYVHRQIIKDNLLNYHENMNEAVEVNPYINNERKNPRG